MLFPALFKKMEKCRWNLENDVPWQLFDPDKLTDRQLHGIKMNSLLEWSAMPTAEMFLRDNSDDADFSAFISIWFFEEQKHSLVLMEYLRRFAPDFVPSEQELAEVRFKFDEAPAMDSLALHFCGEVRLNKWYQCAHAYHAEPVIRKIYQILASDEARHARAYFEYMQRALINKPDEALQSFTKIGVLMTNARLNKVMHPTNLHVNKELYPNDSVTSRLPDKEWLNIWLNKEINFDDEWEDKVNQGILANFSSLFNIPIKSSRDLLAYHRSLSKSTETIN